MSTKHYVKVRGLVNGQSADSIYDMNPFGWLNVTVCVGFPMDENDTLEKAFIRAAAKKCWYMPVNVAKEIEITIENCEDGDC